MHDCLMTQFLPATMTATRFCLAHRARLGEGGGLGLLDFASPGDEVLRGAVEELEAHNRRLQAENQRLQVEVVSRRNRTCLLFY